MVEQANNFKNTIFIVISKNGILASHQKTVGTESDHLKEHEPSATIPSTKVSKVDDEWVLSECEHKGKVMLTHCAPGAEMQLFNDGF